MKDKEKPITVSVRMMSVSRIIATIISLIDRHVTGYERITVLRTVAAYFNFDVIRRENA